MVWTENAENIIYFRLYNSPGFPFPVSIKYEIGFTIDLVIFPALVFDVKDIFY